MTARRLHLLAERQSLLQMIADTPDEDVLDLSSLKSRLGHVDDQIEKALDEPDRATVRVTFSGRPVIDSYGIFAEFGAKAAGAFSDMIAMVAASLTAPLAPTGPIPKRQESQMLITGTALGSFGFEFAEHRNVASPNEQSTVAAALDRTHALLAGALNGTDEDLADSAGDIDPRAVDKVRSFLMTVADAEAFCTIVYRDRNVRFADVDAVKRSLARLSQQNLLEEAEELTGEFQGVFPTARSFEFMRTDGTVIRGKVGPAIHNADELNQILRKPVIIQLKATRVGAGKPRYMLTAPPVVLDRQPRG